MVITVPPGDEELVDQLLRPFFSQNQYRLVPGGKTRQESVFNGLQALEEDSPEFVLIHDGARPKITPNLVSAVLEKTIADGGAIPVLDMVNALVEVNSEGRILANLDRSKIKAVQTPQGFSFPEIWAAHQRARSEGFEAVDDSALFRYAGNEVFTVPGSRDNLKITYPEDIP